MTQVIILAAGMGSRLLPYTQSIPKCLVPLLGKTLLLRQLETIKLCEVSDVTVVAGYKCDEIAKSFPQLNIVINHQYAQTNMVQSLLATRKQFFVNLKQDVIITYGDIIYQTNVLHKLLRSDGYPIHVVIDLGWRKLWDARMADPIDDIETLVYDADECLVEIGKKPDSLDKVQGQYIGMIKISADFIPKFFDIIDTMDRNVKYDGQTFENMYMTTLLQYYIDSSIKVKAVFINNGWVEVDSAEDLERYTELAVNNKLNEIIEV